MYVLLKKSDDSTASDLESYSDEVYGTFEGAEAAAQNAWLDGELVLVGKIELVDWDPPICTAQTYAGSRHVDPEPPEYCEEVAVLGSELCAGHGEEL